MADPRTAPLSSSFVRRRASYRALPIPSGRPSPARAGSSYRESPWELNEPRHFLDACSLCHVPLRASRDVFMYKGNMPFCSDECRQEQIALDEVMERDASSRRRLLFRPPAVPTAVKQATAAVAGGNCLHSAAAEAVVSG